MFWAFQARLKHYTNMYSSFARFCVKFFVVFDKTLSSKLVYLLEQTYKNITEMFINLTELFINFKKWM